MIQTILNWIQPFTVIVFLVACILCFILKDYRQATMNLLFATVNFFVFYGDWIFK